MKIFCKKHKIYLISALHAIALLFVCYAVWNSPFAFSEEAGLIKKLNASKKILFGNADAATELLLVNTAYDHQLVDFYDSQGIPAGKIDITDRRKLLELFRCISKNNSHKYIVCDLFFDASFKTAADDSLFVLLANIPRLVVPKHEGENSISPLLAQKAAFADYKTNIIEGDLLKYQFLQHRQKSIPLFMWSELTGKRFEKYGFLYFMNGKIATNSVILNFQTLMQSAYNAEGEKNYLNLGADLLEMLQIVEPDDFFKGKIVLIGDLTEHDLHNTVAGEMPGVLINYNAFKMLMQNRPVVHWTLWLSLFALFFAATCLVFVKWNFLNFLAKRKKLKTFFENDIVKFIFSWMEFSFILLIFNLLCYVVWGRFLEIFVLSGYFSLLKAGFELFNKLKIKKYESKNVDNYADI